MKILIIYLYISCIVSIIDICEQWDFLYEFLKNNEEIKEFNSIQILLLANIVIFGELIGIIPYKIYRFVKKLGS